MDSFSRKQNNNNTHKHTHKKKKKERKEQQPSNNPSGKQIIILIPSYTNSQQKLDIMQKGFKKKKDVDPSAGVCMNTARNMRVFGVHLFCLFSSVLKSLGMHVNKSTKLIHTLVYIYIYTY